METKRVVLLVALCVLVFVGWSLVVNRLYPPTPPGTPTPAASASKSPAPTPVATGAPVPTPSAAPTPGRQPEVPEQIAVLENPKIKVVLSNRGAGVTEAHVKIANQPSFVILAPNASGRPHLSLEIPDSPDDLSKGTWTIKASEPNASITYGYLLRDGREVERRYVLEADKHSMKVITSISGGTEQSAPLSFRLHALQGIPHDTPYYYERYGTGAVAMKASGGAPKLHSVALEEPAKTGKPVEFKASADAAEAWPDWFGLRNRFFVALIIPEAEFDRRWISSLRYRPDPRKNPAGPDLMGLSVEASTAPVPATSQRFMVQQRLFLSPIQADALREVAGGQEFINYGCCGLITPVGELIVWILGVVHSVVPNYGWAILITTLLVKLTLFPITKKGQVSMARMSELQPKIQALQARHKDDPQRMNQEMWKLWKEEKVAPWSGCLPLMIQMPIFIGLYSVFDSAVEFRNAPFLGWITDLSQPDRFHVLARPIDLWAFSFQEINLLPPVMTVAWFFQALTAPKSPDPNMAVQQKMFLFMPLMFGFMTYSVASGLSLYMCMNFVLGLIEQKLIKTFWLPKKAVVPATA